MKDKHGRTLAHTEGCSSRSVKSTCPADVEHTDEWGVPQCRKVFLVAWAACVDAFNEVKLMCLGLTNKAHKHKDGLMRMTKPG